MIAVAGATLFVVRDMLAAFLMFSTLLVALGITILALFFVGDRVVCCVDLCLDLLVQYISAFRLRHPVPSIVGPLRSGIDHSRNHREPSKGHIV